MSKHTPYDRALGIVGTWINTHEDRGSVLLKGNVPLGTRTQDYCPSLVHAITDAIIDTAVQGRIDHNRTKDALMAGVAKMRKSLELQEALEADAEHYGARVAQANYEGKAVVLRGCIESLQKILEAG